MSTSQKKKTRNTALTVKQKRAAAYILENKGKATMAAAMDYAGYSKGSIKNPQQVTRSKGFAAILDKAGITDTFLAKKHRTLLGATRIEEKWFEAFEVGRGKSKKYRHVSDEFIKITIEGTPEEPTGCTIIHIGKNRSAKRVIFRHPDTVVQAKAMDLAYKSKGHMSAQLDLTIEHELDDADVKILETLFANNRK